MTAKSETTNVAMLKVLAGANGPMGASRLASALLTMGLDLRPRTIRLYLLRLDEQGFTKLISRRRGRVITERGRQELARANVINKVGMIGAKVDTLGYRMTFNPSDGKGTIIINVCTVRAEDFARALAEMRPTFSRDLAMGSKIIVARGGETLGNAQVPGNSVAIGTVCSVTLNGILLHEGIPVISRFGGLLEMRDWKPVRFVEAIEYRGSSLDPLEAFIQADMTRVADAARKGSGVIGASFREVPSVAVDDIWRIRRQVRAHGLGDILAIGKPNQPLFDIPVSEGYSGMVVLGGLNPAAAVHEAGIGVSIRSLAGLQSFDALTTIDEVQERLVR